MKAILTVIGKDKVGIIAGVSNELQRLNTILYIKERKYE